MTTWTRVTLLNVAHLFRGEAFAVRSAGVSPAILLCADPFVAPARPLWQGLSYTRSSVKDKRRRDASGTRTEKEGSCCSW
jgi:hypothetical protein